jgi:hypothetical protein
MWKIIAATIILISQVPAQTADQIFDQVFNDVEAALRISGTPMTDSAIRNFLDPNTISPELRARLQQRHPKLFKFKVQPPQPDPFPWKETAFTGATLLTWVAMGINEGQQWRQDLNGKIDFMWKNDYHVYRGVHNTGLVAVPLIALSMDRNKRSIKWIVGSNLLGWGLYEVALDYAETRSVMSTKPAFKLLDLSIPRPDALACLGLSVLGTIGLSYTF